jgi:hypothetical protein
MTRKNNCPSPTMAAGGQRYGFKVLRVEQIDDIRVTAYEMEHVDTGAKVLHLHCDDPENLYAIGFRTPPPPIPRGFRTSWSIRYWPGPRSFR